MPPISETRKYVKVAFWLWVRLIALTLKIFIRRIELTRWETVLKIVVVLLSAHNATIYIVSSYRAIIWLYFEYFKIIFLRTTISHLWTSLAYFESINIASCLVCLLLNLLIIPSSKSLTACKMRCKPVQMRLFYLLTANYVATSLILKITSIFIINWRVRLLLTWTNWWLNISCLIIMIHPRVVCCTTSLLSA